MRKDFNVNGFMQYYHAKTHGRNSDIEGTIRYNINEIEAYYAKTYKSYRTSCEFINGNKTTFYNNLRAWLMADGLSKAQTETVVTHMKSFIKTAQ